MDPIKEIKKLTNKKTKGGKRFEFRLKINLWKVMLITFLIIFFLPFIISLVEFQRTEQKVEISQALSDIKEKKIK